MRWKTPPEDTPRKRRVLCFALFPRETRQGVTVWLENYWSTQEFVCEFGWEEMTADVYERHAKLSVRGDEANG